MVDGMRYGEDQTCNTYSTMLTVEATLTWKEARVKSQLFDCYKPIYGLTTRGGWQESNSLFWKTKKGYKISLIFSLYGRCYVVNVHKFVSCAYCMCCLIIIRCLVFLNHLNVLNNSFLIVFFYFCWSS